jgi:hypothetical protein
VAVTAYGGGGLQLDLHRAGLVALLAFIAITLMGTVPINKAVLAWNSACTPEHWQIAIKKREG